jgi:hypothetical protein
MRCKPLDFGVGNSPELIWTGGVRERERERESASIGPGWLSTLRVSNYDFDLMAGASLASDFLVF